VDGALNAVDSAFAGVQDDYVTRAHDKTRSAWKKLSDGMKNRSLDPEAGFRLHGELIGAAFDLLEREVDHSKLALDPQAVTYFMIQAALVDLPLVTEPYAKLGYHGGRLLAQKEAEGGKGAENAGSAAMLEQMAAEAALADSTQETAFRYLDKAFHEKPEIRGKLEKPLQAAQQARQRLFAMGIAELSAGPKGTVPAAEFSHHFAEGVEAQFVLTNAATDVLEQELHTYRDGLRQHQLTVVGSMVVVTALGALLVWFVVRSVTRPMGHVVEVIQRIQRGEKSARARLPAFDEIGQLASQFDAMMDEREAAEAKSAAENEELNNSVLTLLQAVAQLARRDLTTRVPVAEDVTGSVADALNMMTSETAAVLGRVTEVAQNVADVSNQVKAQSDSVLAMSRVGRNEVQLASRELTAASEAMSEIARGAQDCNEAARRAIETTRTALESVGATVDNIGSIRETVRETEKRIKRLGERSQEISGVVNLINTISERTHILALNAAMHAASAGEAGRGFAVVAGEVQRLAENAREATSQIATLVHNIQSETADTVGKMNEVISQVVDGSRLAERAGAQMRETEQSTNHLVQLVDQIARSSEAQARSSEGLKNRASKIQKTTELTGSEMQEQAEGTVKLVDYAAKLVDAVSVFRLPESGAAPRNKIAA
jgi:twitching motility protein PilJ